MNPHRQDLIEEYRQSLLRLIASFLVMAGCQGDARPRTMPRAVWRGVSSLLCAAESAVRRLIYVIALELPAQMPVAVDVNEPPKRGADGGSGGSKRLSVGFRLLDAQLRLMPPIQRIVRGHGPRISVPGLWEDDAPRDEAMPSESDPMEARRVLARLDAVQRALKSMDRQAVRMARWLAKPFAARGRYSPLRPGRPPGARSARNKAAHHAHALLDEMHELALMAR